MIPWPLKMRLIEGGAVLLELLCIAAAVIGITKLCLWIWRKP